jgi:hypothetical protein
VVFGPKVERWQSAGLYYGPRIVDLSVRVRRTYIGLCDMAASVSRYIPIRYKRRTVTVTHITVMSDALAPLGAMTIGGRRAAAGGPQSFVLLDRQICCKLVRTYGLMPWCKLVTVDPEANASLMPLLYAFPLEAFALPYALSYACPDCSLGTVSLSDLVSLPDSYCVFPYNGGAGPPRPALRTVSNPAFFMV